MNAPVLKTLAIWVPGIACIAALIGLKLRLPWLVSAGAGLLAFSMAILLIVTVTAAILARGGVKGHHIVDATSPSMNTEEQANQST